MGSRLASISGSCLGGITGHRDFARDTGVIVKPDEAVEVADAIVRVFIEHGDRTDRNKARLKYVLDAWGFEKFLGRRGQARTQAGARRSRGCRAAPGVRRYAHIGVHPQKQAGFNWIGVSLKLGRLSPEQIRGLADISYRFGDGDIRLTVWQNLLISGVRDANVAAAIAAIEALGLSTHASTIRAGLVACTGNRGCKFAASDTKGHADAIAEWCESRVPLTTPVNVHLTGCHHSCAQHYIGDIGLIGARVAVNDEGDTVEGYHLHVGGGYGADAAIARELYRDVKADDAPRLVERVLRAFVRNRACDDESFCAFTRRHDVAAIKAMVESEAAA
jgi:ferredoxin-nitrite reductase